MNVKQNNEHIWNKKKCTHVKQKQNNNKKCTHVKQKQKWIHVKQNI